MELRLVVNTGSIMEDDDQQGLAHMAEHMAFNGTKTSKEWNHKFLEKTVVWVLVTIWTLHQFWRNSVYVTDSSG